MIWRSPAVGQLRQRHFWWIPVKELGIKPATDKSCRICSPQSSCRVDFFWHVFFVSWMPQFLTIQKTNPLSPHELGLKTRNRTPWLAGKIPHRHFHGVPVKKSPWLVRGIYRPCLSRFFRWWLCPCDPKKITIKPYMFPHESGFSVRRPQQSGPKGQTRNGWSVLGKWSLPQNPWRKLFGNDLHGGCSWSFHICSLSLSRFSISNLVCLIISVSYRYFL